MKKLQSALLNTTFCLNILLIFVLLFEQRIQHLSPYLQVFGRLHPMVLHFPVALLFMLLLLEIVRWRSTDPEWNNIMQLLLAFTACSASIVALMGLLLSHSGEYEGNDIIWHKWAGVGVVLLCWLLVWWRKRYTLLYRTGLAASVVLVTVAGHYGGSITHGDNFVTAPLIRKGEHTITNIDSAIVFKDIIQPIFETKCTGCHNPNKSKGKLILTDEEHILKGGEDGVVLVAGNADSSLLYRYLLLPMEDDKHMPPEGKVQLEPEEIALIRWWIAAGADFEKNYAQSDKPDSVKAIVTAMYVPASPLDKLNIPFVDAGKITPLNTPKRGVRQISNDKPYVDVFFGNRKDFNVKELQELNAVRQQVIALNLSNSSVTDEDLKEVAKFPHLQRLYLEQTNITDAGVQRLAGLQYLEYLNLSGSKVSKNISSSLSRISSLKKLYLYETLVVPADLAALQKQLPALKIGFTPSLSDSMYIAHLPEPKVEIDSLLFTRQAHVEMSMGMKGINIYYTMDGTDPTERSSVYSTPLDIDSSCTLKVMAARQGWENSGTGTYTLMHAGIVPLHAALLHPPDSAYMARLDTSLTDLQIGSDAADGKFLGFHGTDLQATFDLGQQKVLSTVSVGYFENMPAYIMRPAEVEIWGSNGKSSFSKIGSMSIPLADSMLRGSDRKYITVPLKHPAVQNVKVVVKCLPVLPKWHPAKGQKAWLFVDEVVFN